jgi:hypothetical protein
LHEIGVVSHGCGENNMGGGATRAKAQSAVIECVPQSPKPPLP